MYQIIDWDRKGKPILTSFVVIHTRLCIVLCGASSFVRVAGECGWCRQRYWRRWRWRCDRSIVFSALQNLIDERIVVSIVCGNGWYWWWYGCRWWWCCGDVRWSWSSSKRWCGCLSCGWFSCIADIIRLRWSERRFLWCGWLPSHSWTILWPYLFSQHTFRRNKIRRKLLRRIIFYDFRFLFHLQEIESLVPKIHNNEINQKCVCEAKIKHFFVLHPVLF